MEGRPKGRRELMNRLRKRFVDGDKQEPFADREYVKESKRLFKLYGGVLADGSAEDRASYDIVTDLIQDIKRYEKAYDILMDWFDCIPEEDREAVSKELEEVDL